MDGLHLRRFVGFADDIYLLGSFDFTFVAINPVNPLIVEARAFYPGRSISHFEIPDLQLKAALKLPPKVLW